MLAWLRGLGVVYLHNICYAAAVHAPAVVVLAWLRGLGVVCLYQYALLLQYMHQCVGLTWQQCWLECWVCRACALCCRYHVVDHNHSSQEAAMLSERS
jgi:hypothetical protein